MNRIFSLSISLAAGLALQFLGCRTQEEQTGLLLSGFHPCGEFNEQELTFTFNPQVRIYINAPDAAHLDPDKSVQIVLYALPNGSSIEQTAGKKTDSEKDWKFGIQHIAAQTRFLRRKLTSTNLIVAYLEAAQRSWPAWKRDHPDYSDIIPQIADTVLSFFKQLPQSSLILSGHSGGGSFLFGYLQAFKAIPQKIRRIVFLDSDYGYEKNYGQKLTGWLKTYPESRLFVLAYNDSVALYKGKSFVSPTGGTWYRSKMMMHDLSNEFAMNTESDTGFITSESKDRRIVFILKKNPHRLIFHTRQVELNGFIHSLLYDSELSEKDYLYFGERAYQELIGREVPGIKPMQIPLRRPEYAEGSAFMQSVANLSGEEREAAIFREISKGNLPGFIRKSVSVYSVFKDAAGIEHHVQFKVMPDYLAIGSDSDFCRIPMEPKTAQRIADRFLACLPTAKIVDEIFYHSVLKLKPVTYFPVGNRNEQVATFVAHNRAINDSLAAAGFTPGVFIAGIKKDIIIGKKLIDPERNHHVIIYGWHRPDSIPIQPVTNIHIDSYVDYSHGVRLINREVLLDGIPRPIDSILTDPVLYKLLSYESGPLEITNYSYH